MSKTKSIDRTALLALLGGLLIAGCTDTKKGVNFVTYVSVVSDVDSAKTRGLELMAKGGAASGSTPATGGRGANLGVSSAGNLLIGVDLPPLAPALPAAPAVGTAVGSWTNVLTIGSGNAIINGDVTAGTTGTSATLNVTSGDLVINGSLISGDHGALETALVLNVPAGTVWIPGSIRCGRVDAVSDGDSGGSVRITALRIIFTGSIDTRGEARAGSAAGDGGGVIFDTAGAGTGQTGQILVGGAMDLSGGDSIGLNASGGDGGSFQTYFPAPGAAAGAIHVIGTRVTCNGGSVSGTGALLGGNGGNLDLQANAGLFFDAVFSGAGGNALSAGGNATGGRGGAVFANTLAIPDSGIVAVFGSIATSGGSATGDASGLRTGGAAGYIDIRSGSDISLGSGAWLLRGADSSGRSGEGGDAAFSSQGDLYFDGVLDSSDGSGALGAGSGIAGTIDFVTVLGDIQVSGTLIADGGNGSDGGSPAGGPSDGGTLRARTGIGGGSITLRGAMRANGGSDSNVADDNHGGAGGFVQLTCGHPAASISLDPGSSIRADGGNAGGITSLPDGGAGGRIELLTGGGSIAAGFVGGNINLRGAIFARGGSGLALAAASGGLGGSVLADSDTGHDGRGGDITLHAGATIDVSGGTGGSGGSALNNGTSGVTTPVAVNFDADGNNSNLTAENGIVQNLGAITARGTGPGATGGDVVFDGLKTTLAIGPLPGSLDLQGAGGTGHFLAK